MNVFWLEIRHFKIGQICIKSYKRQQLGQKRDVTIKFIPYKLTERKKSLKSL